MQLNGGVQTLISMRYFTSTSGLPRALAFMKELRAGSRPKGLGLGGGRDELATPLPLLDTLFRNLLANDFDDSVFDDIFLQTTTHGLTRIKQLAALLSCTNHIAKSKSTRPRRFSFYELFQRSCRNQLKLLSEAVHPRYAARRNLR